MPGKSKAKSNNNLHLQLVAVAAVVVLAGLGLYFAMPHDVTVEPAADPKAATTASTKRLSSTRLPTAEMKKFSKDAKFIYIRSKSGTDGYYSQDLNHIFKVDRADMPDLASLLKKDGNNLALSQNGLQSIADPAGGQNPTELARSWRATSFSLANHGAPLNDAPTRAEKHGQ